jgi:hypothetical protein
VSYIKISLAASKLYIIAFVTKIHSFADFMAALAFAALAVAS